MGNPNGGIHQPQGGIFTAAVLRYQYLSNFPTKLCRRVNVNLQEVQASVTKKLVLWSYMCIFKVYANSAVYYVICHFNCFKITSLGGKTSKHFLSISWIKEKEAIASSLSISKNWSKYHWPNRFSIQSFTLSWFHSILGTPIYTDMQLQLAN